MKDSVVLGSCSCCSFSVHRQVGHRSGPSDSARSARARARDGARSSARGAHTAHTQEGAAHELQTDRRALDGKRAGAGCLSARAEQSRPEARGPGDTLGPAAQRQPPGFLLVRVNQARCASAAFSSAGVNRPVVAGLVLCRCSSSTHAGKCTHSDGVQVSTRTYQHAVACILWIVSLSIHSS